MSLETGRMLRRHSSRALLTRAEVRDLEMKSHLALVQRVKAEEMNLKGLPDSDADQKSAKLTALAQ